MTFIASNNCLADISPMCLQLGLANPGHDEKEIFSLPLRGMRLRSTCPEFILTCPNFFLLCAVSPLLWTTKANCLLISLKYCSVKSLNVYIFRVSGSTLLAWRASCQGALLALHTRTHLPQASGQGFCCALKSRCCFTRCSAVHQEGRPPSLLKMSVHSPLSRRRSWIT